MEREEVNEADGPFQEAGRAMTAACGAREGNEAVKGRELAAEVGGEGEDEQSGVVAYEPSRAALRALRERYCVQAMAVLGEYSDVVGPVMQERGVEVCLCLLQRYTAARRDDQPLTDLSTGGHPHSHGCKLVWPRNCLNRDLPFLSDVLKLVCSLLSHRSFASLFVERGGLQCLLALPRCPGSVPGLARALFGLASIQVGGRRGRGGVGSGRKKEREGGRQGRERDRGRERGGRERGLGEGRERRGEREG